jgi:hypothetical protein
MCLEMEGTKKAKPRDMSFGRKKTLIPEQVKELQPRRAQGTVIKRLCKTTASQKSADITICLYLTPFSAYSSHDLWKKAFCGERQTTILETGMINAESYYLRNPDIVAVSTAEH